MPRNTIISRKPRGRGALTKKQVKAVKGIAKSVAMTLPERKVFGFRAENQQLIHNKTFILNKWLECKQGTADDNDGAQDRLVRVGDEFYLRNINIRLWLSNKKDRPNVMYKVYLFWYTSGATLDDAALFFTQTNKMLDRINTESISLIDQQTIFSGANYATTENEKSYLCTVKGRWKGKKIIYDEGGSVPKKRNIGLAVVSYDAYGTLQSDNIASFAYDGIITIQDP